VISGAHTSYSLLDDPEVIPNFSDYESDEGPRYDVDTEVLEEHQAISLHGKEWMQCLHRDDLMSLTLFLYDLLVTRMNIQVLRMLQNSLVKGVEGNILLQ